MADKLPWGMKNDKLAPGSVKSISVSKLKAFEIGSMNVGKKSLSKREQEELKRKQDEEATKEMFDDFVKSFEGSGKHKSWVKGGVVNADKGYAKKSKSWVPDRVKDESLSPEIERGHAKKSKSWLKDKSLSPEIERGHSSSGSSHKEDDGSTYKDQSGKSGRYFPNRTWVRKDKDSDGDVPDIRSDKVKSNKPSSKLQELASTFQSVKEAQRKDDGDKRTEKPALPAKKRKDDKRQSNLESFKEELRALQQQREKRHELKKMMKDHPGAYEDFAETVPDKKADSMDLAPLMRGGPVTNNEPKMIYDSTDEITTNLYVGNINPKMTEQEMCEIFGKYGPLASVKIMWPRTDEERSRGRNCGFVAYMNRRDGARALEELSGKEIMDFEMKLGWGKTVPIPPHPVYIPPLLAELTMPPPPSGLPFNAQPTKKRRRPKKPYGRRREEEEFRKTLASAVVKVVIPTDRTLLCTIHRLIEFVIREGPMFEAMIMNREINNPMYRFLFENQSPAHVYYRWKLFSMIQGDTPFSWHTEEFLMFRGGSIWRPPVMNPYTQGMPDELVRMEEKKQTEKPEPVEVKEKKGKLTDSQRDRLEDMLRELTPEKNKIADSMVWCLDHADSAEEIVECITESLSILQTPIPKKAARLFLVSDILYNSSAKVPNASFYRKHFQHYLSDIFKDMREAYENIDGRLKAEQFRQKVVACFKAWEDWAVYPNDFLINLQNIFLGLVPSKLGAPMELEVSEVPDEGDQIPAVEEVPLPDVDIDGKPLDDLDGDPISDDIDGIPLMDKEEDLDGKPIEEPKVELPPPPPPPDPVSKFVKSKWEEVDEAELEAQAMTTSKWDLLDQQSEEEKNRAAEEEDVDGVPLEDEDVSKNIESDGEIIEDSGNETYQRQEMTEERRNKLREIEVKVMKYQDELEVGKRSRKSGLTMLEQIEYYRKKLLHREAVDSPGRSPRKRHRSRSFSPLVPYRSHSNSPKRSKKSSKRSRSRSPRSRGHRRSTSRSPSRRRHKSKKKHRD